MTHELGFCFEVIVFDARASLAVDFDLNHEHLSEFSRLSWPLTQRVSPKPVEKVVGSIILVDIRQLLFLESFSFVMR
jgi:hypothetical protein